MKLWLAAPFATVLLGFHPVLWAFCSLPQPRFVCAEATSCQAIVVAQLLTKRHIEPAHGEDYFLYSLRLMRALRGSMPTTFVVHEGNDSGRAPFYWVDRRQYLLFLFWVPEDHGWELDGCGNSAPLTKASAALRTVETGAHSPAEPLISGEVSNGSGGANLSGVSVTVSGARGSFHITTNSDGQFHLRVPPGTWSVSAQQDDSSIPINPISYSLPDNLHLTRGACVQLQFTTR